MALATHPQVVAALPTAPAALRARALGYCVAARRILSSTKRAEIAAVAALLIQEASYLRACAMIEAGDYPAPTRRREARQA